MSRKIQVATTSLATLEDVSPPFNLRYPAVGENLALSKSLLEAAGQKHVDLVCLPESILTAGLPYTHDAIAGAAQSIPGPAFDVIADCARRYGMYVVAGLPLSENGTIRNAAVLVDRRGRLVGYYSKMHPTEGEIACGVIPGTAPAVYSTDFGNVGIAICFDLNWPDLWAEMAQRGADLVCWLSAYPGGLPLQAFAWMHRYRIVSAVWPYDSRIIDITGKILASTSRWSRIATAELDLDKRLFHTDGQAQHILPIQTRYGLSVSLETFTEEHLFTLESCNPDLSVDDIKAEFNLVEYKDYLARCTQAQQTHCK